jgi:hypothetical protein
MIPHFGYLLVTKLVDTVMTYSWSNPLYYCFEPMPRETARRDHIADPFWAKVASWYIPRYSLLHFSKILLPII